MSGVDHVMPEVVVVMGVMGSGKSSVGRALADTLRCPFQEGDAFHSACNIEKMRAGAPLDDADRMPWLDRVADWIATQAAHDQAGVIACSALRRTYRDRLRIAVPYSLPFVLLNPSRAVLEARLRARAHSFAPASLLESQLDTLEPPSPTERALVLSNEMSVEATCAAITCWLTEQSATDLRQS